MLERIYLLPSGHNCYKANLHSHTVLSDGRLTAKESKEAYKKEGYSIIAFTDHRYYKNHKELNEESFLAIAGYEVDINEFFKTGETFEKAKTYHINLYDCNPELEAEKKQSCILPERRYYDSHYINEYIEQMKQLGFIACYNHPYWSLQNYSDFKELRGLWGMEIYNHGCMIDGLYGYHSQAYDELLRLGNRMFCVATDDNHNQYEQNHPLCDSFGGFTYIYSKDLSYSNVMDALVKGNFYSSMGPTFEEMYLEGNKIVIKTSPVQKIYVKMEGRNCYKKIAPLNETISYAEFELSGKEGFIRVECMDYSGKYCNTNAYFIDQIYCNRMIGKRDGTI